MSSEAGYDWPVSDDVIRHVLRDVEKIGPQPGRLARYLQLQWIRDDQRDERR